MSEQKKVLQVGLIMPISPIDGCTAEHWAEVKSILTDAVESITQYKCQAKIVSEADDVGVIQKRIVQNIYSADIIICDVSCKNSNVMFELGMRLAFDKPTVIVKDDITGYSFDTGIIEHLEYPRDLRFAKIVDFKRNVARKVAATFDDFSTNPDHSTFLKNFGEFKVSSLKETPVTPDNLILEMLTEMQSDIALLKRERYRDRDTTRSTIKFEKSLIFSLCQEAVRNFLNQQQITVLDLDKTLTVDLFSYVQDYMKGHAHAHGFSHNDLLEQMNIILYEMKMNQKRRYEKDA